MECNARSIDGSKNCFAEKVTINKQVEDAKNNLLKAIDDLVKVKVDELCKSLHNSSYVNNYIM